jgi:hypothetical protein
VITPDDGCDFAGRLEPPGHRADEFESLPEKELLDQAEVLVRRSDDPAPLPAGDRFAVCMLAIDRLQIDPASIGPATNAWSIESRSAPPRVIGRGEGLHLERRRTFECA